MLLEKLASKNKLYKKVLSLSDEALGKLSPYAAEAKKHDHILASEPPRFMPKEEALVNLIRNERKPKSKWSAWGWEKLPYKEDVLAKKKPGSVLKTLKNKKFNKEHPEDMSYW